MAFYRYPWVTLYPLSDSGKKKNCSWSSQPRWDVIILGSPALRVHWCPLEWRAAILKSDSVATWQKCNHGDLSRVQWLAELEESVIWSRPCHFQHGLLILRVTHQQNDNKMRPRPQWLRRTECYYFLPPFPMNFSLLLPIKTLTNTL